MNTIFKQVHAIYVIAFAFFATYSIGATPIQLLPQSGHTDEITSIAYSSDGAFLISGSNDTTVKVWDVASGAMLRTFSGHNDAVSEVAWIPNTMRFVSGSWDTTLKIWDAPTGEVLVTKTLSSDMIIALAVAPDGSVIVCADTDNTLYVVTTDTLTIIKKIPVVSKIHALVFSSDGKTIAAAHDDGSITIRSSRNGSVQKTLKGHTDAVYSVSFSSDNKRLVSGSYDRTVKVWDMRSTQCLHTLQGHTSWINSVVFSSDGALIASASADETVRIWNSENGTLRVNISTKNSIGKSVRFSKDNNTVAVGGSDRAITLFQAADGSLARVFKGLTQRLSNSMFSPDGKSLLIGSDDASAVMWEIKHNNKVRFFGSQNGNAHNAIFSHNGKYYTAIHDADTSIRLYDNLHRELTSLTGHTKRINATAFSPNDTILASCDWEGKIRIWSVPEGKLLHTFSGHTSAVWSMTFTPDSGILVSSGEDRTIRLWNLHSGKQEAVLDGHTAAVLDVAVSPDGTQVVSCSLDGTLKLWDITTKRYVKTLFDQKEYIYSVDWPRSDVIITGSKDKTLRVLDATKGIILRDFKGHTDSVMSTDLNQNATLMTSASPDGSARIWDFVTGKEIAQCIPFTNGEWIIVAPDGYFMASKNGARYLNVVQGMKVLSIDSFFDTYYRPDIITARLQLNDIHSVSGANLTNNFKVPPILSIAVKDSSGQFSITNNTTSFQPLIENGNITIRVTARDGGGGVKGIRVFNNEKTVGENIRAITVKKEQENRWDFVIALSEGDNIIRVVGFSDDMTESNPVSVAVSYARAAEEKPNMYVVAVGINTYKNSKYNLTYCVADVTGFLSILRPKAEKLFGAIQTAVLTDSDATKENILAVLEDMRKKIQPKDVFVFFYAGHGIALDVESESNKKTTEFFYVLSNVTQMTNAEKCANEALSGSELKKKLTDIHANKQVLFVDACNSGAFATQFAVRGAAEENALAKLSRATGSVVFASTTQDQYASEFRELQHGVFTYVVIEALTGKGALTNGQLTVKSIMGYVEDKIPEYTQKYKGEPQYPTTFMHGQDFPLGLK